MRSLRPLDFVVFALVLGLFAFTLRVSAAVETGQETVRATVNAINEAYDRSLSQ